MKKLILLSLAIISSNAFGYSLEEQLCSAVNNCDVNKTKDLISKIGEVNAELKLVLIKSAQNNIEHYQNASKFILLSPRDTANFIFNGAVGSGCILLINLAVKRMQKLNNITEMLIKHVAFLEKPSFAKFLKQNWNTIFNKEILEELEKHPNFKDPSDSFKIRNGLVELDIERIFIGSGLSIAAIISLTAAYKIIKSLGCSSACDKLSKSQAVYSLISEIKVKEIEA